VTGRRGKPKTVANAAFLGELACYRQKAGGCCANVTNSARDPVFRIELSGAARQFSTWFAGWP
jgi:hypothetical protein